MLLQLNQSDLLNITSLFEDNGNYTNNNVTISSVFKPNPMNRNLWAIIFKLIGATIAIPLNLLLSIIILHLRRFRSKPRNLFLLGILFSNLTATIPPLVEVVDYFFISPPGSIPEEGRIGSSLVSCKIYIVIRGLPEVFLLLNILFSLVDKYVAITHHLWHREKVTIPKVIFGLILTFISPTTLLRLHLMAGWTPLRCRGDFWNGFTSGIVLLVLFVLCVIIHVLVYVQSRRLVFQCHSQGNNGSDAEDRNQQMIELQTFSPSPNCNINAIAPSANESAEGNNKGTTAMNPRRLRRMEEESTRALLTEVTALLVLFCPTAVYHFSINMCRLLAKDVNLTCNAHTWFHSYLKQLGLIHAVYHPALCLIRNREFSAILKRFRKPVVVRAARHF